MTAVTALPQAVRRSLRRVFGIEELREGQQEVITRVLAGEDTLALMPAGAGKSLCYQLPALHLDGLTLVVSPLISLMKDQARQLEDADVVAEQLNSARPLREQAQAMERIAGSRSEIVFTTPERLEDPAFVEALQRQKVALLVVDEAHCISQWGHDFRPAFLQIGPVLKRLGSPTVLALTATATPDVLDDIRRQIGRPRMRVVHTGVFRPNLRLQVTQCVREDEKFERLVQALARASGPGIVYTATVKACNDLHDSLLAAGVDVTRYHGRLRAPERSANQDRFMSGQSRVMVATNAFGMGIDKPDIRYVIHYQMPGTPEAYYQEAGRAGRDGLAADCLLLFFRRDRQVQQFFIAHRYPGVDDLRKVLDTLKASPAALTVPDIDDRTAGLSRNRISVALTLLREGGLAWATREQAWNANAGKPVDDATLETLAADYREKAEKDRAALERMVFYAQTGFCRWRVLLDYFDEPLPFANGRCGICDNCLRARALPQPQADEGAAEERTLRPAFRIGDAVRVPRFGGGQVKHATADEVTVVFTDGSERSFVAAYVKRESQRRGGEGRRGEGRRATPGG